jgi:hypothetical protein
MSPWGFVLLSLVDSLRCPAGHEETSLVLSVESWSGQRVSEGLLGCPLCHARYPIRRGAVDFAGRSPDVRHVVPDTPVDPMRLAAQLSLTEPGGILLLTGRYAANADQLAGLADVACLLVDAPPSSSPTAVDIQVNQRLPLLDRALRGAAIDESRDDVEFLAEVARCVRPRGRIVAPASSAIPGGSRLIARDHLEWVAELEDVSPPIQLRRAPPV